MPKSKKNLQSNFDLNLIIYLLQYTLYNGIKHNLSSKLKTHSRKTHEVTAKDYQGKCFRVEKFLPSKDASGNLHGQDLAIQFPR
jgi:hypothetical protein